LGKATIGIIIRGLRLGGGKIGEEKKNGIKNLVGGVYRKNPRGTQPVIDRREVAGSGKKKEALGRIRSGWGGGKGRAAPIIARS